MKQLYKTVFQKIFLLTSALFLSSCLHWLVSDDSKLSLSQCVIICDEGSSGTRLYLYAKQGSAWKESKC